MHRTWEAEAGSLRPTERVLQASLSNRVRQPVFQNNGKMPFEFSRKKQYCVFKIHILDWQGEYSLLDLLC